MRILVAAGIVAGTSFAYAINTIKMAEGFSLLGHDVTLACRAPLEGPMDANALAYQYALHSPLRWVQLPSMRKNRMLDLHWDFARQLLPRVVFQRPDFVFSRSYITPWLSSALGIPTAAESHAHPGDRSAPLDRFLKGTSRRHFRALVTIAPMLRDNFAAAGVPREKILVLPDAVDLHNFLPPAELPASPYPGGPNVVYCGHLYDYKGIPDILGAARVLPDVTFHLIGGLPEDVQRVERKRTDLGLTNVVLHGHKPRTELPPFLWHADALLLPPSATHPSAQWTSPVKLGEYLAAGKPLVSSDIPALRNWLTDAHTRFVTPDDPDSLAKGIQSVLAHTQEAQTLAANGQQLAHSLSYTQRAQKILTFSNLRHSN